MTGVFEAAWRKVLSFEPRNLFAVPHLARIAAAAGRAAQIDSLLGPFADQEQRTDRRLVEIKLLRAISAGDTTAAFGIADEMRIWEDFATWRVAVFVSAFSPNPGMTAHVIRKLSQHTRDPAVTSGLDHDVGELLRVGQPAQCADRVLKIGGSGR